jgi:hypothetical protein
VSQIGQVWCLAFSSAIVRIEKFGLFACVE